MTVSLQSIDASATNHKAIIVGRRMRNGEDRVFLSSGNRVSRELIRVLRMGGRGYVELDITQCFGLHNGDIIMWKNGPDQLFTNDCQVVVHIPVRTPFLYAKYFVCYVEVLIFLMSTSTCNSI